VSLTDQETTYSITFTMNNDTDTQARIVLDMGLITGDVWISEIDFEEIRFITTGLHAEVVPDFRYFPNPVDTRLYLSDYGPYQQAHLFDLKGNRLRILALNEPLESIDMGKYPPGMYMIGMSGGGLPFRSVRIIKN
jgi:hypothetical protein